MSDDVMAVLGAIQEREAEASVGAWWHDPDMQPKDHDVAMKMPDGSPFAVAGLVTGLYGLPEARKTTALVLLARQAADAGRRVLWLTELPAWRLRQLLRNAGGDPGPELTRVAPQSIIVNEPPRYGGDPEPTTRAGAALAGFLAWHPDPRAWIRPGDVVVIDPVAEFGGALMGAEEHRQWTRAVVTPWTKEAGAAVVLADHTRKPSADDESDSPYGTVDKISAFDLSFRIDREEDASAITQRKDRYGLGLPFGHSHGSRVASVIYEDAVPRLALPSDAADPLARAIVAVVAAEGGSVEGQNRLRGYLQEAGHELGKEFRAFDEAVRLLKAEGTLATRRAGEAKNAAIVYSVPR